MTIANALNKLVLTSPVSGAIVSWDGNENLSARGFFAEGASTVRASSTNYTLNAASGQVQFFTGNASDGSDNVDMPTVSSFNIGALWYIVNTSTQEALTVRSSGGNTICSVPISTTAVLANVLNTGTTAASWAFGFLSNAALSGVTGTGEYVGSNSPTLVTPNIGVAEGTSLNLGGSTTINGFIDDDSFATASATTGATSESIKAYVDAVTGGSIQSVQVFTSSGTWTKPGGINKIVVEVLGGGAGGAGCNGGGALVGCGGGGGSGAYAKGLIDVSAIGSETVTIGAAGAAGAAGTNNGGAGGTSSFGAHISCTGGNGGISTPAAATDRGCVGGLGGTASGGDINANGDSGVGATLAQGGGGSGKGAASIYGGGGLSAVLNTSGSVAGIAATGFGSGGGGGISLNSGNRAGGAGTAGLVVVWEYN